jgi:gliding motility-associated-like protein
VGPTDFTVTLTVTNGSCTDVISKKITVNQSSSLTVSANPVCNSSTVVFTAHVPSYVVSYVYDFGDGTQTGPMTGSVSHVYPNPGNYNVILTTTDNNGCIDPVVPLVMNISGPTVMFTSSGQQFCGTGASSTFPVQFTDQSTPSSGSAIAKWEWDFGDGQTSTAQSPSHTYTNEGIYTVKLRVTDALGCVDSLVMPSYITFSKPVAKFTTADVNFCPSSQIKFTNASSSAFNPVYTWDFGDGSAPFTGANPPSHNYPADGDYTVKLSMTDSYGCTSTFDNAAAPIHIDHPVAGFTVDNTFSSCPPLTAHFTFTGSYAKTYIWSFGDGVTSNNPTTSHLYSFPGDYIPTLTIISPGGCSDQFTGPDIHIEGPIGQFDYSPLGACNDINVNFKVTTANVVQFTWLYGDGTPPEVTTTAPAVHEDKDPGVYIPGVILKDASGCEVPYPGSQKIVVDGITKTEFTADKTVLCDNGTINFKDASVLGFGTVISTYVWDFGDGSAPVAGMNPTISHAFTTVGNYNVKLTITTVNGCAGDFTMPVEVAASPQIEIGGLTPQCEPATLNFTGIELVPDPNGPLTWAWDFDNGQTSNVQNPPAVLYPKAGSYDVSVVATNTKGCSTTYPAAPNPLLIYKIPAVDAGKDMTVCLGGPDFALNATGDIGNSYTWEAPVNGTLSCLACADPMANSPVSTYFVVNGLSPFGCQAKDTVNITVNTPVTVSVSGPDSVCLGQSAQLNASGAAIYEWTPADGLSDPSIANPVSTPTSSMLGTDLQKVIPYQVTGWDNIKCFQDTKTVNITAFSYPKLDVGPDVTIPVGSSYQINGTGSADIVSLNWTPATALSCTDCLSPLANPIKTTTYVLNAVNNGTCVSADSIKITVICNNGNFFIPNTFSPNGDGSNDRFIVRGKGLNVIPSITIFNRWGQVVFERRNFAPNDPASGWDGTFNGKPAPSDVYIYTVQILCDNATLIPYHGNVTLIR